MFTPNLGEDFQCDTYFSDGLKPPTRETFGFTFWVNSDSDSWNIPMFTRKYIDSNKGSIYQPAMLGYQNIGIVGSWYNMGKVNNS